VQPAVVVVPAAAENADLAGGSASVPEQPAATAVATGATTGVAGARTTLQGGAPAAALAPGELPAPVDDAPVAGANQPPTAQTGPPATDAQGQQDRAAGGPATAPPAQAHSASKDVTSAAGTGVPASAAAQAAVAAGTETAPPVATQPSGPQPSQPATSVKTPAASAEHPPDGQPAAGPVPPTPAPAAAPATVAAARPAHAAAATPQLTPAGVGACVERIHELVRIAGLRDGHARATLQLRPAELGQVAVHLRTTDAGLIATIRAHDAAAVSALQHAGAELRQSLESRGVTLARIDVQLAPGGDHHGRARHEDGAAGRSPRIRGVAHDEAGGDEQAPIAADELTTTTIRTDGALVDVRA